MIFSNVFAETGIEFGLTANSGWSNNKYLEHPDGWGFFVSKSLSQSLTVRFSSDKFSKDFRYIGVLQFGYPPPNPDTTREFISSEARIHFYEFSIHHVVVNGNKMRLDVGGGLGLTGPKLKLRGEATGKTFTNDDGQILLSFSIDVTIKKFIYSPLALRIGYHYRAASYGPKATDTFYPFDELSLSSINVNLLARF